MLFGRPARSGPSGPVLTFAAVLGIALLLEPDPGSALPGRPRALFSGLAAALAAQAGTAPIVLWRFNVVSAGAWLTAPLAIPLAAGLIAVGAGLLLFYAVGISPTPLVVLFALGARGMEFLAGARVGDRLPEADSASPLGRSPSAALRPRASSLQGGCGRRLSVARPLSSPILALRPGPPGPTRGFSLEALDVGQGDALLLRWRRHAILVDGGGPFDLDAGATSDEPSAPEAARPRRHLARRRRS